MKDRVSKHRATTEKDPEFDGSRRSNCINCTFHCSHCARLPTRTFFAIHFINANSREAAIFDRPGVRASLRSRFKIPLSIFVGAFVHVESQCVFFPVNNRGLLSVAEVITADRDPANTFTAILAWSRATFTFFPESGRGKRHFMVTRSDKY